MREGEEGPERVSWGRCWVRGIPAREARGQGLGRGEQRFAEVEAAKRGPLHRGGPRRGPGRWCEEEPLNARKVRRDPRVRRSTEGSQSVRNPEGSGHAGPKSDQGLGGGRSRLRTELEAPGGGCLQNWFQHWTLEPACWTVGPRGPTSWHVGV